MKLLVLLVFSILSSQAEESQVLKWFSEGYDRGILKTNSAKGQTAEKLTEALDLPDSSEKINEIFTTLAPSVHLRSFKLALQDEADFSGIGAEQQNLKIRKVVQKVFIEVEETGTTTSFYR
ncbi:hypothetical protein ILUMI_18527 [Ignelater luminosus]|uniref:Serpin domain-containing protein n=1 Tax=Ignelater luminosus TaxID=2038154 RepID=A0A8K0CL54_IGNLU|nr:hypothetical protein ILUMI_18527 [Ignelater luminosus]